VALERRRQFGGMAVKFNDLPEDCSCLGEGPAPVSRVPRLGAMPELVTYQCAACGHVETIESQPYPPKPRQHS
jgi:hypothetical protein